MITDELNRVISSIAVESPMFILERLEERAQADSLGRSLAKAASHGLSSNLTDFTTEQLIRVAELYLQADSTTQKIFSSLLEEFGNRIHLVSFREFFLLCRLCDSLDSYKAKSPPNQMIVQFLTQLQTLLFQQLCIDKNLLTTIPSNPSLSITLIEMLLKFDVSCKKLIPYLFYQAQPQLTAHYRFDEDLALHALIFYARMLSRKLTFSRLEFYRDPFYRFTVASIQRMARQADFRKLCELVESCALAHIRDLSLFRTVTRAVCRQEVMLNLNLSIRLLDSYAKLNIPDFRILDLVFDRVVTQQLRPGTSEDQLTMLHGAALCGAYGATKIKVCRIVASMSPHVVTQTNAPALLKLELIRLFCSIRFPTLTHYFSPVQVQQELGVISKPQKKVSNFLTNHGIEHDCEVLIECYPYPVDIVIPSYNVVIEVDGPQHFDISGRALLGKDRLKNLLISAHWKLIRIPSNKINTKNLQILLNFILNDTNRLIIL